MQNGVMLEKGRNPKSVRMTPMKIAPSFMPRNQIVFDICQLLMDAKQNDYAIVSVIGEPGLGKSTILRAVGRFFDDRSIFDSIIYFDFKQLLGQQDFNNFLAEIYTKISESMPMPPLFFLDGLNKKSNLREKSNNELISMVQSLIFCLGDSILLIWDNLDGILQEDNNVEEMQSFVD